MDFDFDADAPLGYASEEGENAHVPGEVNEIVYWTPRKARTELRTRIGPRTANHSFNGLLFDVRGVGLEDVLVHGVVVGGEIGNYVIFAREGSWRQGYTHEEGWTKVAEGHHAPAPSGCELALTQPVLVRSGQTCAIFVHSRENNDRGICYQSFHNYHEAICADGNLAVYPGQARIGTDPFVADDELNRWGWHRGPRGLAGALVFACIRKPWSVDRHRQFPRVFRDVVVTLLWCARQPECGLSSLPTELFLHVSSFMDWRDWPCLAARGASPPALMRSW
jgi:hypothetical protein